MNSIKVCEYSRSRSFHDDLILQDQASGERSQDHWSSGFSFQSRTEDLTHNVRGLCPRLSIHVSSVYCSKIDLSF